MFGRYFKNIFLYSANYAFEIKLNSSQNNFNKEIKKHNKTGCYNYLVVDVTNY